MGLGSTHLRPIWPHDTAVKPIPAGFTRDIKHDSRFLQGDDAGFTGAANAGGAHTHVDSTNGGAGHTHTGNSHLHTVELQSDTFNGTVIAAPPLGAITVSAVTHGHAQVNSHSATITYSTDTITIANANMQPPFLRAILLQPDDAQQEFPADGLAFGDSASAPDGFGVIGAGWDGKFILGAAFAGVGGGTGGSTTHNHGGTTNAHTHTPANHSHVSKLCGSASATVDALQNAPSKDSAQSAHHNVSLNTKILNDVETRTMTIGATSSEPAYVELLGLVANADGTPDGIVLPFVGPVADLPSDGSWILCDGAGNTLDCTNRQVKMTTDTGSIGDTGGSDAHTHAIGSGHVHTHGTHNHAATQSLIKAQVDTDVTPALYTRFSHTHAAVIGNTTPTMGSESHVVTVAASDGRAAYRTVIWVKRAYGACTVNPRGGQIRGAVLAGV